jgi:hypothetical protein
MNRQPDVCAWCNKPLPAHSDEEEAAMQAELKHHFGDARPEETAVICDDCFQRMHPDKFPHEAERAMAETVRARITEPPT